jgi:hypothetical protein
MFCCCSIEMDVQETLVEINRLRDNIARLEAQVLLVFGEERIALRQQILEKEKQLTEVYKLLQQLSAPAPAAGNFIVCFC